MPSVREGKWSHDGYSFRVNDCIKFDAPEFIEHLQQDFGNHHHDHICLSGYNCQLEHHGLPTRASKKAARNTFLKAIKTQGTLVVPDHVKAIERRLFERYLRLYGPLDYAEDSFQYLPAPYDDPETGEEKMDRFVEKCRLEEEESRTARKAEPIAQNSSESTKRKRDEGYAEGTEEEEEGPSKENVARRRSMTA